MITLETITEKLGFNPLTHDYSTGDKWLIDDSSPNPLSPLSLEELDYLNELFRKKYAKQIEYNKKVILG